MIQLIWDTGFKRAYKKRIAPDPILKDRFWDAMELFVSDPFADVLRTHKLTGKLSGSWAFSVEHDCRVVFQFVKGHGKVLLIDVGTHDEVY
jgi:addiction module RelE/StbE family toxin